MTIEIPLYLFFIFLGVFGRYLWERHRDGSDMPTFSRKEGWVGEEVEGVEETVELRTTERNEFERFRETSEVVGTPWPGTYESLIMDKNRCPVHNKRWWWPDHWPSKKRYCAAYEVNTTSTILCPQEDQV